jgi:acyl carrier protein
MTEQDALALIRSCVEQVAAGKGDGVTLDTDLVADGLLDSLDVMSFLFELEQALGRKLEAITEEYQDFRVSALVRLLQAAPPPQ